MPDLHKGHVKLLTSHHGGLSLYLPSPLASTLLLQYSSLPAASPVTVASLRLCLSSPSVSPPPLARQPLMSATSSLSLLIFIFGRGSVPTVRVCHTNTPTCVETQTETHPSGERDPAGA